MLKQDGSEHFLHCFMALWLSLIDKLSHLPILEKNSLEDKLVSEVAARH
jgi:hypothetical protein